MDAVAEWTSGTPRVEFHEAELEGSGEIQHQQSNPPEVWVCGHTVVSPEKRVWCQPYGTQLGIASSRARVSWLGTREMLWDQLLPLIQSMVQQGISPNVIIIHLGENDLVQQTELGLTITMKNDLTTLCRAFPMAKIVWSTLLPRRTWLGAQKPEAVDKTRKAVVNELSKFCSLSGISVLRHDQIVHSVPELFSQDGVHLSEIGASIFNANLREAIEACL
ncbi:uncharacterized protein LOC103164789 [Ornithorhynchus anatinus]|uniref:uncharacterized protein LOC103164789 n=1 Tax=Ornithorhynchus anatinus TaxID=9258 RepID=UPI00045433FC|nr:uncharacterized protein LOC103164789 [Ornithorhynchus anatinus]